MSESLGRQHCDERHSGANTNKDGRINGSVDSQIPFFKFPVGTRILIDFLFYSKGYRYLKKVM